MTNRTTINVAKTEHKAARKVKDEYDETWTDVLDFYASNRGMVSNSGLGHQDQPIQDIDTVSFDDVKAACKAALNDELPEHAFRQ